VTVAVLATAAITVLAVASSGLAARTAAPANLDPPTVTGKAEVGGTLAANVGRWSNNPTDYDYDWRRCDGNGGSCSSISGANTKDYVLKSADRENTLRVRVTARNADGAASATSVPTAVVASAPTPPPTTGCGNQGASVPVAELSPPDRLMIDRQDAQPSVLTGSTSNLSVRFRVSACNGKPVQGALVYVTATPYNQFSIPTEVQTGADGWAQLDMHRLGGYPATARQRLIVLFVRARKAGENELGGISTRRLVSFRVNLSG
jgi:hypothetical protein